MAKPTPTLKGAPRPAVDQPPPVPLPVAAAIKALHAGEATAHQQQLALQAARHQPLHQVGTLMRRTSAASM